MSPDRTLFVSLRLLEKVSEINKSLAEEKLAFLICTELTIYLMGYSV